MVRSFFRGILFGGVALIATAQAAFAGMTQDLADCTAADRKTSVGACTRVINSGALPDNQFYIGYYNRAWSHFSQATLTSRSPISTSRWRTIRHTRTPTIAAPSCSMSSASGRSRSGISTSISISRVRSPSPISSARKCSAGAESLERAYTEVRRAADLDPNDRKVQVLRALILSDKGDQRWAREDVDKVLGPSRMMRGRFMPVH